MREAKPLTAEIRDNGSPLLADQRSSRTCVSALYGSPAKGARGGAPLAGGQLLLVGDAAIGIPTAQCVLLREMVMHVPARLKASKRNLLKLDFDTLLRDHVLDDFAGDAVSD